MADNRVVNVCFHGIGTPGRELEAGEDRYWVSVDQFHEILDEVATWPAVRVSFDDGNASDAVIGLPALVERKLPGDFFVVAGRLGQPGSLAEEHIGELRRHGMAVGSHGMHHRSWRGMDPATRRAELVTARERIAEVSGAPVDAVACPLGAYDHRVLTDLREQGYSRVYTSDRRATRADAWLQPRYSVRHNDTPQALRAEIFDPAPVRRRIRASAVGLVKRWR